MLSISFLPWILLLLAIVISIPVVNYVENSRRKKALAELEAERAREQAMVEDAESEEVVGEGFDDQGGFGDFGAPGSDASAFDPSAPMADFDEDALK